MSPILEYLSRTLPAALHDAAHSDKIDWRLFVLAFATAQWLFESYLVTRQIPLYSKPPPAELVEDQSPEEIAKSQAYGRDKAWFSLANLAFDHAVGVALVWFNGFAHLWNLSGRLLGPNWSGGIAQSLLFPTLLTLATALPGYLPALYSTFVIEDRHGFNKSTLGLWVADKLKEQLLFAAIGLPLLAGFLKIIDWAGDNFVGYLMLFLIAVQLFLATIFPTFIQPLFNKFTPLPPGEVRTKVEALALKLKFPLTHLYEIDGSKRSSHSNAYFFGLPWSKRIVIYDTLIEKASADEVEAVLAHELGHWARSHPTRLLLMGQAHLLFTLSLLHFFLHNTPLLRSFRFPPATAANPPIIVAFLLSQLVLSPLDAVFALAVNVVTRKFEYEADRFAAEVGGPKMAEQLKIALRRLHVSNASTIHHDWLYSAYHHNHPTLPERTKALDDFTADYFAANGQLKVKAETKKDL